MFAIKSKIYKQMREQMTLVVNDGKKGLINKKNLHLPEQYTAGSG